MKDHKLAIATVVATFLLVIVGGAVHATDAGLACGNVWPSCDGDWFPAMVGGVEFEHSHRVLAAFVGLMTLLLARFVWQRRKKDPLVAWVGLGAVALVIFQALLGRKTVIEGLPDAVSSSHLATSMAFFCTLIWIAFRTASYQRGAAVRGTRFWIALAVAATYVQVVLGAVVRHTDAGLACTDFPLCGGVLFGDHALMQIHMVHRIGAVVASVLLLLAATVTVRRAPSGLLRTCALLVPAVVLVQVLLGVLSVTTALSPVAVTAHLGLGALLLGLIFSLWVLASGAPVIVRIRETETSATSEARA